MKYMKLPSIVRENTICKRTPTRSYCGWVFSYPVRDNVINEIFPLRFCLTVVLLMAFPQVEQKTKRHQPHFVLRKMKL